MYRFGIYEAKFLCLAVLRNWKNPKEAERKHIERQRCMFSSSESMKSHFKK